MHVRYRLVKECLEATPVRNANRGLTFETLRFDDRRELWIFFHVIKCALFIQYGSLFVLCGHHRQHERLRKHRAYGNQQHKVYVRRNAITSGIDDLIH